MPQVLDPAHAPQPQPAEPGADDTAQSEHFCGMTLLRENLSVEQLLQYDAHRYFDVIGGTTGTKYQIWHGYTRNIHRPVGQEGIDVLCFHPSGGLCVGDVLLAQKLALELFEFDALRIANVSRLLEPDGTPYYPGRDTAAAYAAWYGTSRSRGSERRGMDQRSSILFEEQLQRYFREADELERYSRGG